MSQRGGVYNILDVMPYKGSCRIRLPQIISEKLESANIEIRINKSADILVMLPGADMDFAIRKKENSKVGCIYSAKLAAIFEEKKIILPAKYKVAYDERVGGWVCRKVD